MKNHARKRIRYAAPSGLWIVRAKQTQGYASTLCPGLSYFAPLGLSSGDAHCAFVLDGSDSK